jgi:hypothetical protein
MGSSSSLATYTKPNRQSKTVMRTVLLAVSICLMSVSFPYASLALNDSNTVLTNRIRSFATPTNAALRGLSPSRHDIVVREGVDAIGDAPPLTFKLSLRACSAPDGYLEVALADGGCAQAVIPASGVDPREEGAPSDGTTDAWDGLERTFIYVAKHGGVASLPGGMTFTFAKKLSIPSGYNSFSIIGHGYGSVLLYDGSNTTNDLITIGTPRSRSSSNGLLIAGFRIDSSTAMTGGAALHLWHVIHSRVDPIIGGQSGNGNFYNGIWFDECDVVSVPYIDIAGASNADVTLNGSRPTESWYPNYVDEVHFGRGKISPTDSQVTANMLPFYGVHIAGGVGGATFQAVDIIANRHNVQIDKAISGTGNQSVIFGPESFIDISQYDDVVIADNSSATEWQGGTKLVDFDGWIASAGRWRSGTARAKCVNIYSFTGGTINFRGNAIAGCEGNAIYDQDNSSPAVSVTVTPSEHFYDNGGVDIASAYSRPLISVTNPSFTGPEPPFDANTLTSTGIMYTGLFATPSPVSLAIGGSTTGITYRIQKSFYQLIGKNIIVDYALTLTSKGTLSGILTLTNLPFGETPGLAYGGGGAPSYYPNWQHLHGALILELDSGGAAMANIYQSTATGTVPVTDANLTNTSSLWGQLRYSR